MTETRKAHCQPHDERSKCSVRFPVLIQTIITSVLGVALLSSAEAQGRRDAKTAGIPPPVVSQALTMQRGERITIPLGIHGTRGEMLEFLIRTPAASGRLSPVKSTGMNSATVTYSSSERSTAPEDRFTYAVRGSEGVSAAGVVTIRFVAPLVLAPKLRTPNEVEFPTVFSGQRSSAELEIANEGGGILEGEVAVQDPWSIEGLKIFKIAAGRTATFQLVFTPVQAGVKTGEAIISGTQKKVIPLRATAEDRLEAAPALLKLTAQPGNQTRMGALKITNRSEEDATVNLEAGTRLLTDRTVKVPARGTSTVPVFADAAQGAAFDDAVKLTCREWSGIVKVHAVAVGAILRFSAEELSITGTAGDTAVSGTAILENSGGEPVTVRLDVEKPFEIETRVATAPAHGRVEIPILVHASSAGIFRTSLKAIGEGGSAITLVKAEVAEAVKTKLVSRSGMAAPVTQPDSEIQSDDNSTGIPIRENDPQQLPQEVREIPNAFGKFARGTGADTAVIRWPANLGPVENLRIEERVLSLSETDELQIEWSPLPSVTIKQDSEGTTAELHALKPKTLYTIRVFAGKNADATVLFTADFWTAAKEPPFTDSLLTPLLIVALCILLFAIWRSRRAARKAAK